MARSSMSVAEQLHDAMQKGDVLELDEAVTRAQGVVDSSPNRGVSSLRNLLEKARGMLLEHMDACGYYVKPLRRACRALDENAIFSALLRIQNAPERVQLFMYSDIRFAEDLREDIIAAREEAANVLDSEDWQAVDKFLSESAPVLEDRTVLALVQKREDLLRAARRGASPRASPRATSTVGHVAAAATVRSYGGEPDDRRSSVPSQSYPYAAANADPAMLYSPAAGVGYSVMQVAEEPEVESVGVPLPRTHSLSVRSLGAANGTSRGTRTSLLPEVEASRPLSSQQLRIEAFKALVKKEVARREHIEGCECTHRAQMFSDEMVCNAMVQCGCSPAESINEFLAQATAAVGAPPPPRGSIVRRRDQNCGRHAGSQSQSSDDEEQGNGAYNHKDATGGGHRTTSPAWARAVVKNEALDNRDAIFKAPAPSVQQGIRLGLPVKHSLRDPTPDLSPIKDSSLSASAALFLSTMDAGASPLVSQPRALRHEASSTTPVRRLSNVAINGATAAAPPRSGGEGPLAVKQRLSREAKGSKDADETEEAKRSARVRRVQASLRTVPQEEDIHRRDIEGSESFDRSVFLFPMAARIAMLKIKHEEQLANLRFY